MSRYENDHEYENNYDDEHEYESEYESEYEFDDDHEGYVYVAGASVVNPSAVKPTASGVYYDDADDHGYDDADDNDAYESERGDYDHVVSGAPASASTSAVYTTPERESAYENYRFDVTNGVVTAAYEVEGGRAYAERLQADESYTVSGTSIIKTETGRYGQEVTTYIDTNGNGLYAKVSEQWVPTATAATTPSALAAPQLATALSYISTDGNDDIAVRAGQAATGGQGADRFVVREAGHVEIEDFHGSEGDHLVFDTGLGLTSLQDLLSYVTDSRYDGHDFYVEFQGGASVTLVGVAPADLTAANVAVLS